MHKTARSAALILGLAGSIGFGDPPAAGGSPIARRPLAAGGSPMAGEPTTVAGPRAVRRTAQQGTFVSSELLARLEMEVPVPVEEVFDAWTIAELLVEWFPSSAEITVTEGGEYRLRWDGWDDVWSGTYLEVERPERLVFTWQPPAAVFPDGAYETTVTLLFEEIEGGTRLRLEHGGFRGGAEMESHMQAWRGYLFNLRAFLLQR